MPHNAVVCPVDTLTNLPVADYSLLSEALHAPFQPVLECDDGIALLHFAADVEPFQRPQAVNGSQRRVPAALLLSTECLYLCNSAAEIIRCVSIEDIEDLMVCDEWVCLCVPSEYDVAFRFVKRFVGPGCAKPVVVSGSTSSPRRRVADVRRSWDTPKDFLMVLNCVRAHRDRHPLTPTVVESHYPIAARQLTRPRGMQSVTPKAIPLMAFDDLRRTVSSANVLIDVMTFEHRLRCPRVESWEKLPAVPSTTSTTFAVDDDTTEFAVVPLKVQRSHSSSPRRHSASGVRSSARANNNKSHTMVPAEPTPSPNRNESQVRRFVAERRSRLLELLDGGSGDHCSSNVKADNDVSRCVGPADSAEFPPARDLLDPEVGGEKMRSPSVTGTQGAQEAPCDPHDAVADLTPLKADLLAASPGLQETGPRIDAVKMVGESERRPEHPPPLEQQRCAAVQTAGASKAALVAPAPSGNQCHKEQKTSRLFNPTSSTIARREAARAAATANAAARQDAVARRVPTKTSTPHSRRARSQHAPSGLQYRDPLAPALAAPETPQGRVLASQLTDLLKGIRTQKLSLEKVTRRVEDMLLFGSSPPQRRHAASTSSGQSRRGQQPQGALSSSPPRSLSPVTSVRERIQVDALSDFQKKLLVAPISGPHDSPPRIVSRQARGHTSPTGAPVLSPGAERWLRFSHGIDDVVKSLSSQARVVRPQR